MLISDPALICQSQVVRVEDKNKIGLVILGFFTVILISAVCKFKSLYLFDVEVNVKKSMI